MTAREIRAELPAEPALRSVVLVDTKDPIYGGGNGDQRYAFQRLQESGPSAWHMVGRDIGTRPLSWDVADRPVRWPPDPRPVGAVMTGEVTDRYQDPVSDTSIVTARALLLQHAPEEQSPTVVEGGGLATVHVLGAQHPAQARDHLRFDALVQAALRRYANEWAAGEHPAEVTS